jgi:hypothetical protein
MCHTILRTSDPVRVITQLGKIGGHIQHCNDLSAMMLFIADLAGREEGAALLVADPAACARVWRGIAAVQQQLQESLALMQAAAEELHDLTTRSTSGAP